MKKIVGFLAVLLMTASCVRDVAGDGPNGSKGDTKVVLRLRTPSRGITSTRALTDVQQEEIKSIFVLVFNTSDEYTSLETGEIGADKASFSVALSEGTEQKLLVLANVTQAQIDDANLSISDTYDVVQEKLKVTVSSKLIMGINERIPMSGLIPSITPAPGMAAPTVLLTRSLAKVEVGLGAFGDVDSNPATADAWSGKESLAPTAAAIPFVIETIHLVRPNNNYMIVPAAVPLSTDPDPGVSAATVSGDVNAPMAVANAFSYAHPADAVGTIYVPEFKMAGATHENQTAIVIGGKYNGGETSYYRVNFAPGGILGDILRNHSYRIDIMSVNADGQADVPAAYAASALNMIAKVSDWEEEPMDIHFNGAKFVGITPDGNPLFNPYGKETQIITFTTNADDFKITVGGTDLVAGTLRNSTDFSYLLANPATGEYSLTVTTLSHNVGTATAKTEEITISGGGMDIPFTSTQSFEAAFTPTAPAAPAAINAPYILYYDKATRKLAVGRWADKVNKENVLYTQFGSLVAFTNGTGNGDAFDASDVIFNPTNKSYAAADWTTALASGGIPRLDQATAGNNQSFVTNSHTSANVVLGMGDICKLVGLTEAQAKNLMARGLLHTYDSGLRLPTQNDNIDFAGLSTTLYGATNSPTMSSSNANYWGNMGAQPGAWFPILGDREAATRTNPLNTDPAGFLPAVGNRNSSTGAFENMDGRAHFWSATLNGQKGRDLDAWASVVGPADETGNTDGFAIRCVSSGGQTSTSTILATAITEGGYVDADGTISIATTPSSGNPYEALVLAYDGGTKYTEGVMRFAGAKTAYSPSYTFQAYDYYPVFPTRMVYPAAGSLTLYGLSPVVNGFAASPGAAKLWNTDGTNPRAEITGCEDLMASNRVTAPATSVLQFKHLLTKLNLYVTAVDASVAAGTGSVKSIRLVANDLGEGATLNTIVTYNPTTATASYSTNGKGAIDFWKDNNTIFSGMTTGSIPVTRPATPMAFANVAPVTSTDNGVDYYIAVEYSSPSTPGEGKVKYAGFDLKKIDGTTSFTGSTVGRAFDVEVRFEQAVVAGDLELTVTGTASNGFGYKGWTDAPDDIVIPNPSMLPLPPRVTADRAPYILYVNGEGKLDLGQWGAQVAATNIVYVRSGSLIGVVNTTGGNSDPFSIDDVAFNPIGMVITGGESGWKSLPATPNTDLTGVPNAANYITANHTAANVSQAKGDICRLVGLTEAQAKTLAAAGQLHLYNSGFRLPTAAENQAFTGGYSAEVITTAHWDATGIAGMPGGYFPGPSYTRDPANFLPAIGGRASLGTINGKGSYALYLTSAISGTDDVVLRLNNNKFTPAYNYVRRESTTHGFPIRCVRN